MARYQHVAEAIRAEIESGKYAPGEQLPPAPMLGKRFGVSPTTLWRCYDVLQAQGLVERRQGQGVFVREAPTPVTYLGGQSAADGDADASIFVSTERIHAADRIAELMQVAAGVELVQYSYFALRERHPYVSSRVYVPVDLADRLPLIEGTSPWGAEVSRRLVTAGVQLADVTERVSARLPTELEAVRLKTAPGTWVMEIEQRWTDTADRVVQGAHLVLPADRVSVQANFPAMPMSKGGEAA